MPGRQNFNPKGKTKLQVQIHNLVHDSKTVNEFLNGLEPNEMADIADELKRYNVNLLSEKIPFDPKPYVESNEVGPDSVSPEEKERQLHLGEKDKIKSYKEFSNELDQILEDPNTRYNKIHLYNALVFIDNCYGGTNADKEDIEVNKYVPLMVQEEPVKAGPELEANIMKTHVAFMDGACKKLSNALSKYKKLEKGYVAPPKKEEKDISLDDSSFIENPKIGDYKSSAERFKSRKEVMEDLEALDKVYHQMYAISNRMTDSSEFKKMLGNLKEIHEVYTYYQNGGNLDGKEYTGDDLVNLIKETADNTTKYIDKLGANNKFRSSDKGNTKLLGAVQVLSTINPEYTKQKYSKLKLKMPNGQKTEILKDIDEGFEILRNGKENTNRPRKITFDALVEEAVKQTGKTKQVADNKARREFSRMKKRAANPPVIDNSLKNNTL
jgi:hypothetical protein